MKEFFVVPLDELEPGGKASSASRVKPSAKPRSKPKPSFAFEDIFMKFCSSLPLIYSILLMIFIGAACNQWDWVIVYRLIGGELEILEKFALGVLGLIALFLAIPSFIVICYTHAFSSDFRVTFSAPAWIRKSTFISASIGLSSIALAGLGVSIFLLIEALAHASLLEVILIWPFFMMFPFGIALALTIPFFLCLKEACLN
jgi:hypothetical protein